ncbi:Cytochrome P450 6j1 [Gryllus bimaculatus]|nr:Cytochrome P450 6j1 [Gryllus bimaculatus]
MGLAENILLYGVSLLAVVFIAAYLFCTRKFGHWKKKGVKYLKPIPFAGSLKDVVLMKKPLGLVAKEIYEKYKIEPFIGIYAFDEPVLQIHDIDLVKTIFMKDFSYFCDRSLNADETADPLFAKALFCLNGDRWRQCRTAITPSFTSAKMKNMFELVMQCTNMLLLAIEKDVETATPIGVYELAARYTTDAIATCAFGIQSHALNNQNADFRRILRLSFEYTTKEALAVVAKFLSPKLATILGLKFVKPEVETFIMRTITSAINEREEAKIKRNDLLDSLIQLKDSGRIVEDDTYVQFDLLDVASNSLGFLLAAFETSATTMTYILYELAMNETLRKYPPVPFIDRVSNKPYTVPGTMITLEAGSRILVPNYGFHTDPEYFPNPKQFDPERFSERKKNANLQYYMPFGEGPRSCPAAVLAAYLFSTRKFSHWKKKGVKHLTPIPFAGSLKDVVLMRKPLGVVTKEIYEEFKTERFIGIYAFDEPVLQIHDLDLVKAVLVKDFQYFCDRSLHADENMDPFLAKGIFCLKGDRWKKCQTLRKYPPLPFIDRVSNKPYTLPGTTVTLEAGSRILIPNYGFHMNPEYYPIPKRFDPERFSEQNKHVKYSYLPFGEGPRNCAGFRFASMQVKTAIARIICNYSVHPSSKTPTEIDFTPKTFFLAFLLAAFDSSATTMSYILYELALRNDIRDKLRQQIQNNATKENLCFESPLGLVTKKKFYEEFKTERFIGIYAFDDRSSKSMIWILVKGVLVKDFQYFCDRSLHADENVDPFLARAIFCLKGDRWKKCRTAISPGFTPGKMKRIKIYSYFPETLRKYPPLPFIDRVSNKPYTLPGSTVTLEAGSRILIPSYGFHMNPEYYPNPKRFDPERFSEQNNYAKYSHLPFGEGPRNCAGTLIQNIIEIVTNYILVIRMSSQ